MLQSPKLSCDKPVSSMENEGSMRKDQVQITDLAEDQPTGVTEPQPTTSTEELVLSYGDETIPDVQEIPKQGVIDLTLDDDDFDKAKPERDRAATATVHIKDEPTRFREASFELPNVSEIVERALAATTCNETGGLPDILMEGAEEEFPAINLELADWQNDEYARAQTMMELAAQADSENLPAPDAIGLERNQFDSELEDQESRASFAALQKKFEGRKKRGQTTVSEDIEFKKSENTERERLRRRERKRAYNEAKDKVDTLFCSDGEHENSALPQLPEVGFDDQDDDEMPEAEGPDTQPRLRANNDEGKGLGLGHKGGKGEPRKRRKPNEPAKKKDLNTRVRKPRATTQKKRTANPKAPRGRKTVNFQMASLSALFGNHDIVAEAQANQGLEAGPQFPGRNRKLALSTYIESMPADQRDLHNSDRKELEEAIKQFTRPCRLDGTGKFKLSGMISSLHNHQVIGAGFMRQRESGKTLPLGGLLSDEMGFGKTITCLAAILDDQPPQNARSKTTLIITPPALTAQWLQEIDSHFGAALGSVLVYRSGNRIMSNAPLQMLSSMDVVITTYHEVMRSFPKNEPPVHLVSKQAKEEWWQEQLRLKKGLLHQMTWHRIVCDEAQSIKNRQSKTFEAVVELNAKYRWALSGTPIQNSLDELYPYFRYLRLRETGDFTLWKRNFNKKGSRQARKRLFLVVGQIMCRRTHVSRLFGKPLIKLPNITTERIRVDFNEVERTIYRIVKTRFVNRIKAYGSNGSLEKNYQHIFVLILRLRQIVGHILLVQKTLKELLDSCDLERLWLLCEAEKTANANDGSTDMLRGLRKALENVAPNDPSMRSGSAENLRGASILDTRVGADKPGGLTADFRKYLEALRDDGQWERINMRSHCTFCGNFPHEPYLTACMHIYCHGCLELMEEDAKVRQLPGPRCVDCGIPYGKSEPCTGFGEAANGRGTPASTRSTIRKRGEEDDEDIDWYTLGGPMTQSAKTRAVTELLRAWFAEDPSSKCLVFTQFRGMIRILKRICLDNGWPCAQFHGAMSFEARDAAIQRFTHDPDTKILLAAMKAGGVGLNLCAANRCIIIDLWWNQSVETQAFCRMFRIGQERDVKVVRLTVNNSVDDDIIKMQERKNGEIEPVIDQTFRSGHMTTRELLTLFGPLELDEQGNIVTNGEDEPFIFPNDPHHIQEVLDDD